MSFFPSITLPPKTIKKFALGILTLVIVFLVTASPILAFDQNIDKCVFNIYTNVDGLQPEQQWILSSETCDPGHRCNSSFKIPFNVPLKFSFEAQEGDNGANCENNTDIRLYYSVPGRDDQVHEVQDARSCRASFTETLDYGDYIGHIIDPYGLEFSLKDFEGDNEDICVMRYDFDSSGLNINWTNLAIAAVFMSQPSTMPVGIQFAGFGLAADPSIALAHRQA